MQPATVLDQFHRQLRPARQAYQQFLKAGLRQGHDERYYETVDQRFLGDARFVAEVDRRAGARYDVTIRPRQVTFERLLHAIAHLHGVLPHAILAPGRQRAPVPHEPCWCIWRGSGGRSAPKSSDDGFIETHP